MLSSRQEEIGANQGQCGLHLLRTVALFDRKLPIFAEQFVQCHSRLQRIQKPHDFGLRVGRFGSSVLNAVPRETSRSGMFEGSFAQSRRTTLSRDSQIAAQKRSSCAFLRDHPFSPKRLRDIRRRAERFWVQGLDDPL